MVGLFFGMISNALPTVDPGRAGAQVCGADSISASSSIPACAEPKAGTFEDSNLQYSPAIQTYQSVGIIGAFVP